MKVVRFLERKNVIRFFGAALVLAPFVNIALHIYLTKMQNHMTWQQIGLWQYLKSGNTLSYFLAVFSVFIGFKMLTGATTAWKYVLFLLGAHLLIQIVNINNKAWQGPLAWPTFLLNTGLFFFIIDQLVWKVQETLESTGQAQVPASKKLSVVKEKHIINLKSYRKILFSFGGTKPWGELKTLSSEELSVKSFAEVPKGIENQVVQINFSRDVVVEIKYSHHQNEMYYFKPLNMQKDQVTRLNNWLKKIAV